MKRIIILFVLVILLFFGIFGLTKTFSNDKNVVKNIFKSEIYASYKAGDIVSFADDEWIVMYDSSSKEDSMTLINSGILYLGEDEISDVIDGIYETSKLNDYLENDYANLLGEKNLVEKNGYKVRLLNMDDIKELTEYEYDEKEDRYVFLSCPDYICLTNNYYATMIDTNNEFEKTDVYNNVKDIEDNIIGEYQLHLKYYNIYSTLTDFSLESIVDDTTLIVRPVINVYKGSIGKE